MASPYCPACFCSISVDAERCNCCWNTGGKYRGQWPKMEQDKRKRLHDATHDHMHAHVRDYPRHMLVGEPVDKVRRKPETMF